MPLLCILVFGMGLCHAQEPKKTVAPYTITIREVLKILNDSNLKILGTIMPNPDLRVELTIPKNTPIRQFMDSCLSGTIYTYRLNTAGISFGYWGSDTASYYRHLEDTLTDANGIPLADVNVKANGITVQTDTFGHFSLHVRGYDTWVEASHVGYRTDFIRLSNKISQKIAMEIAMTSLDAPIIDAYGNTTQRKNPGDVYPLQQNDLGYPTTGAILENLAARVPGLYLRSPNGVPGSAPIATLDGTHSISNGNNAAIIVDDVPLPTDNGLDPIGTGSAQGATGANPLNSIPREFIDTVSVLKDASSMAAYGSGSANGVILIKLIQAKHDSETHLTADLNQGLGHVASTSRMLTTPKFIPLRQEAVKIAGGNPADPTQVPELQWGNRQNNFQKLTTGGTAHISNARVSVNAGKPTLFYLLSGNIHRETGVFPSKTTDERNSLYANLHIEPKDQPLRVAVSLLYTAEDNHLPVLDPTRYQRLAPNAIPFYDPAGHLQWGQGQLSILNIPAQGLNAYTGNVHTLFGHIRISYRLNSRLSLEQNLGGSLILTNERSVLPKAAQDSNNMPPPTGTLVLANNRYSRTILETLARWNSWIKQGELTAVLGVDKQEKLASFSDVTGSGYTSDQLLYTGQPAPIISPSQNKIIDRYAAIFAKADYILYNRYLLTASWRCDGSSRFGPGNQFGSFWAIATGWIFTEEPFLRSNTFLSYGKIRASLGTTGNDQIHDGGYAEVYAQGPAIANYPGQQGVVPVTLANMHLHWEQYYRAEAALELGFMKNKLLLSVIATRNWSVNQVINAPVAPVAGLSAVYSNQPIEVVNEALEMILEAGLIAGKKFSWKTKAIVTVPRNEIARWPDLASSEYASTYILRKSLTVTKGYHLTGIDSQTGLYTFQTKNPGGIPGPGDKVPDAGVDPRWYAGWDNRIRSNSFELGFLFDIRFTNAVNPLIVLAGQNAPGQKAPSQLSNGPKEWLDHWSKPGDHARLQQLSIPGSPGYATQLIWLQSDAYTIDGSYIRLKNVNLTWYLPNTLLKKWRLSSGKIYLSAQNCWTLTHYPVTDPETQDPRVLPPLRVISAGIGIGL